MRVLPRRLSMSIAAVAVLGLVLLIVYAGTNLIGCRNNIPAVPQRQSTTNLDAYRGIASWVDLFDTKAWRDPTAVVDDMANHGVRTIFVETATARSSTGLVHPVALGTFITEAHARDMYVVAWYPPHLRRGSVDYERIMQAIEFTTSDGQKFDSVALDIESTTVKTLKTRNRRIVNLSRRIRKEVGGDYPLGGIIPSPVGLLKQTGFWNVFPYTALAKSYDVFLPMSYYTFHVDDAKGAYADTKASMRILRAQPGCSEIPVHIIGGLAGPTSPAQVRQFAIAARETGCIGVSLYDWVGMNKAKWRAQEAGWREGAR